MNPEPIVLSPMNLDDLGEILTLQRAAYATEAQLYDDPFLPALVQTAAELAEEITHSRGMVARAGARIAGALRWTTHDGTVHIGRITIAPDLQGRGIGTQLLRAAETASGASRAELFTGHLSAANIRLYEREGYKEFRRETLRPGVELVYLARVIPR